MRRARRMSSTGMAVIVAGLLSCGGESAPDPEPEARTPAAGQARSGPLDSAAQLIRQMARREDEARRQAEEAAKNKREAQRWEEVLAKPVQALPESFPPSIGEYPGIRFESGFADQDSAFATLVSEEDFASLHDSLGQRLRDAGWTISTDEKGEDSSMLVAEKEGRKVDLALMAAPQEGTLVMASIQAE